MKFIYKNIKNLLFYFCVAGSSVLFLVLMLNSFNKLSYQAVSESHGYLPTIIIDAGHGGEDGGAVSQNGSLEKDINLIIANELNSMLKLSGFETIMTREDDVSIYDEYADTIKKKKVSDLKNRLKIIKSEPNCIFISIHQNKFTDSKYSGAQVFYSKNDENSQILANSIKDSIVSMLQPDNKREIKPSNGSIYLLDNANVPAVLVECGFLSNAKEAALLSDSSYQKKITFAIYNGILDYWRMFV